jgi:hypothetical protein
VDDQKYFPQYSWADYSRGQNRFKNNLAARY